MPNATRFLLPFAALLFASPAFAIEKVDVAGGTYEPAPDGVLVRSFECKETLADGRGRNGLGLAGCLRGVALDPESGRSTVVVELVLDTKDPLDLSELKFDLRLDSGRTERVLEDWTLVASHGVDAELGRAELFEAGWLEPTSRLVAPKQEDERRHVTLAWNHQTWDPSVPLEHIQLKVGGKGAGGKLRWILTEPLAWDGPWDARATWLWDSSMEDVACSVWRIRKQDADKASDALSEAAHDLPLQMRFQVLSDADDGEFEVHFPDHRFTVAFAGGKLKVRGREDFTLPVDDGLWRTGSTPNELELVYDGTFVTLSINGETFGPMAGKQREGKRFRWEFGFDDAKNEIRNLQVAPCRLEDPERWAAPKDEPVPPSRMAVVDDAPTPTGSVVLAVLSKNGRPTEIGRKRDAKSALQVMQKAAAVGQGLMATGRAMDQFGKDVNQNLDAMERGDVESMKSSSTRVDIGPCGTTTTRSEVSLSDVSATGATVDMRGQQTSTSNPGCVDGQPVADLLPAAGAPTKEVLTLTVEADEAMELSIGGDVVGSLGEGERWVLQVAPGEHPVAVNGKVVHTLVAKPGKRTRLRVDAGGAR